MNVNTSSPAYVVVFCAAFAGAFTAVVMALQTAAAPRIRRNEVLRDQRALAKVLGLSANVDALAESKVGDLVRLHAAETLMLQDPVTGKSFRVYRATEDGASKGLAFEISGTGFWAPIRGLIALTPDGAKVLRVVFTEQKETPGLGGRIEEEAFQRDQFAGLDVSRPPEGKPYVYVASERPGNPSDPRYGRTIEAITGATQTSRAVGRFLNADLAAFHRAWDAQGVK